jgi:retron-type reverse transcriptase
LGKQCRSGEIVRSSSSIALSKILLLPEVPQMLQAQEITHKLFLQLQSKIDKAPLKIQKILNEDRCLHIITLYLRCLDKFKNSSFENIKQVYIILKDLNFLLYAYSMIKNRSVVSDLDNVPFSNIAISGIIKLAEELNHHTYKPNSVRRVKISKAKGRFRPLGIANSKDKVVQQALYMILSPFYESSFSENCHGFRPGKSTHTCLDQIKRT